MTDPPSLPSSRRARPRKRSPRRRRRRRPPVVTSTRPAADGEAWFALPAAPPPPATPRPGRRWERFRGKPRPLKKSTYCPSPPLPPPADLRRNTSACARQRGAQRTFGGLCVVAVKQRLLCFGERAADGGGGPRRRHFAGGGRKRGSSLARALAPTEQTRLPTATLRGSQQILRQASVDSFRARLGLLAAAAQLSTAPRRAHPRLASGVRDRRRCPPPPARTRSAVAPSCPPDVINATTARRPSYLGNKQARHWARLVIGGALSHCIASQVAQPSRLRMASSSPTKHDKHVPVEETGKKWLAGQIKRGAQRVTESGSNFFLGVPLLLTATSGDQWSVQVAAGGVQAAASSEQVAHRRCAGCRRRCASGRQQCAGCHRRCAGCRASNVGVARCCNTAVADAEL
eukprot:354472-Chlamydomonas_euryale.AAC.4